MPHTADVHEGVGALGQCRLLHDQFIVIKSHRRTCAHRFCSADQLLTAPMSACYRGHMSPMRASGVWYADIDGHDSPSAERGCCRQPWTNTFGVLGTVRRSVLAELTLKGSNHQRVKPFFDCKSKTILYSYATWHRILCDTSRNCTYKQTYVCNGLTAAYDFGLSHHSHGNVHTKLAPWPELVIRVGRLTGRQLPWPAACSTKCQRSPHETMSTRTQEACGALAQQQSSSIQYTPNMGPP